MRISDWSSDVCSSDLELTLAFPELRTRLPGGSVCCYTPTQGIALTGLMAHGSWLMAHGSWPWCGALNRRCVRWPAILCPEMRLRTVNKTIPHVTPPQIFSFLSVY